jgi:hypothetical protein
MVESWGVRKAPVGYALVHSASSRSAGEIVGAGSQVEIFPTKKAAQVELARRSNLDD